MITGLNWSLLSSASKSVFPVIACHCDNKGDSFPSENTIAILSGLSDKQARAGINGLCEFPDLKIEWYVTKTGKWSRKFQIPLIKHQKGKDFAFHKAIIEGGNWRMLKPTAQALYPVMRAFSFFDKELYFEETENTDLDISESEITEVFINRQFDFCEAEKSVLLEHAGITRRSLESAFQDLVDKYLIEHISAHKWKVFIIPPKAYKLEYLNKQISESYKHLLNSGKKYRSQVANDLFQRQS